MSKSAIVIEGVIYPENDGSWSTQSFLTFADGEQLCKTVNGLTSREAAELARDKLIAEAEAVVVQAGGYHLKNDNLH